VPPISEPGSPAPFAAPIPRPALLRPRPGRLVLTDQAAVSFPPPAEEAAGLLRELLGPATGFALPPGGAPAQIDLSLSDDLVGLGPEGYRIVVDESRATLSAWRNAGLVNAVQTLRQLLDPAIYRGSVAPGMTWEIPCLEIEDQPRFGWRGAHLDVSRHFMPAPFLFRFVDLLAMHKLNTFHLHLTDDQGWRFPSRKYPRLTEIGSWRAASPVGHRGRDGADGTPHGGSYTREELVALVAYAERRNITVMPEIDLPGHTLAAIAAYPRLGNLDEQLEVWTSWGVTPHVMNLNPETLGFCQDVLAEVLEVFPSPYIHVGGDECPTSEWMHSPAAQAKMRELGLTDPAGLQNWFTGQLNRFLLANGRHLVGWDEIIEVGTPPEGATVMSWRGEGGGVSAAGAGFDVVMCPEKPVYFDHYQGPAESEPLAIGGLNTLEDVYAYEPVPEGLSPVAAAHVLGSQFQVWTEYIADPAAVEYMSFPRGAALAEVLWSPAERSYADFNRRLSPHLARLDVLGVNYRRP
jgi:hexosaminidase